MRRSPWRQWRGQRIPITEVHRVPSPGHILDDQTFVQPSPPVVEVGLDLLQKSAGHAGRGSLTLFPRSDGFHIHAKELAENRLADPQRRAGTLDLLGAEDTGRQIE